MKTGFDISCLLPLVYADNLHEMSNPVFWENKKKIKMSAEYFTQRVKR